MTTALLHDERYFWYDFGDYRSLMGHPLLQPGSFAETAESKRRVLGLVQASGLIDALMPLRPEALGEDALCLVHDPAYVARVRALGEGAGGVAVNRGAPVPAGGFAIAALAAGGTWAATRAVLRGEARNAYALVRPPGHHAERDHGWGLCVFANAAIAARLAIREHGLARVAILDWDAHHGNGTESAFLDNPAVLTISIHQDHMVPGRGGLEERGQGAGLGYNINIPLPPGSGTGAYLAAMDRVVLPALRRFRPELILVASGVDACATDPTARMLLQADSYRMLALRVMEAADALCGGRLVMTHEGGYDPSAAPFCVHAILEAMSGSTLRLGDPFGSPLDEAALPGWQALQPHQDAVIRRAEALAGPGG